MADLSDLTTGNIGYITFWNALNDGGVSSIDAEEVLTDGNIINYTLFDNGVEGTYKSTTGRDVNFRVKNDGWHICWIDRTNNFGTQVSGNSPDTIRGYHDIATNWNNVGSANTSNPPVNNTFERVINSLASNLSNFGSITYNATDVGLYNYEFTGAVTTVLLSSADSGDDNETTQLEGIIYTPTTNILHAVATGATFDVSDEAAFQGTVLATNDNEIGARDLIANSDIPNAETEYQFQWNSSDATFEADSAVQINFIAMWS